MAKNLFPVGKARYFELRPLGRFNLKDPSNFGIFFADINAPESLSNNPFLLTKIKGRTIAPIGTWSGWYFSEELKYAVALGYRIKVHKGYKYNRDIIFKDYVKTLYANRQTYDKLNPKNLISKLLLNSLYGRFGMSPVITNTNLVPINQVKDIIEKYNIDDVVELGDKALISTEEIKNINLNNNMLNISLPIAIAITAYSRIAIHK
jgi:hypothetical protein